MSFGPAQGPLTGGLSSPAEGTILATTAVVIGSADTSGVRLEVDAGVLAAREGNDSADAPVRALSFHSAQANTANLLLIEDASGNDFLVQGTDGGGELKVRNGIIGTGTNPLNIASGTGTYIAGSTGVINWRSGTTSAASADTGLARSAAGVVKVTDGSTGYGSVRAEYPRRVFEVIKTPGTGATLTAIGGTPTHTLSGTASNVSDSSGHYVQLSATNATAGIEIASTECTKTENGPIFTAVIKTGAVLPIATERLWIGLSSAALAASDSPTGAHVAAFRYAPSTDGTAFWRLVTNDGGADTGTTTTSTIAIAISTRYVLTIDATNSASIAFYINGALAGTAHTTNLPTATQALGTQCFVTDVTGGSTKELLISKIRFETN